jgi:hypothetical protein
MFSVAQTHGNCSHDVRCFWDPRFKAIGICYARCCDASKYELVVQKHFCITSERCPPAAELSIAVAQCATCLSRQMPPQDRKGKDAQDNVVYEMQCCTERNNIYDGR